jgi:dTDP-4-amino-4,6-dideoxygalactose transaminase
LVFSEIDPVSLMMDAEDVARRVTPRTRVIVPVHYAGLAADLPAIAAIANNAGATLVEDAAQGLDAALNGKALGTFGRFGCLSFHETKNLHAGLCGALFVNDTDSSLVDRAVQVWERGTNRQAQLKGLVDKYTWTELGSSFYPSELQAAFMLAQLEALDHNREERRLIHEVYLGGLTPLAAEGRLSIPPYAPEQRINYHAFFVVFPTAELCDRVRVALKESGIAAYIGYVPLHSSPMGRKLGWNPDDLPITEGVAQRVLRLPFHNDMTPGDAERVVALLSEQVIAHG